MAFYLFQVPDTWTEWLSYAIIAVQMCEEEGMEKGEAMEYLLKQDPGMVIRFVKTYDHFLRSGMRAEPFTSARQKESNIEDRNGLEPM